MNPSIFDEQSLAATVTQAQESRHTTKQQQNHGNDFTGKSFDKNSLQSDGDTG